jgi:hypothetical protein
MEKMSKEDEARILRALENVVQMTNKGVSPDEALHKVAEAERFGPHVIQRMVEAYNVSKTLSHMKHATGPERADSFPLADAAPVLEKMYPEKVLSPREKAASVFKPSEYVAKRDVNFMNRMTKLAMALPQTKPPAPLPRDRDAAARCLMHKRAVIQREYAQAKSEYRTQWQKLQEITKEAALYFRSIPHTSFDQVERNVVGDHGSIGKAAMDLVFQQAHIKEARDKTQAPRALAYDASVRPYPQIKKAIDLAGELEKFAAVVIDLEMERDAFELEHGFKKKAECIPGVLDELFSLLPYEDNALVPFEKDALIPTGSLFSGGMRAFNLSEPNPDSARLSALSEVYDPAHEEELRSIKVKAMLNDFLSNDPIMSGQPPEKVLNVYNQISSTMPQLAGQPAVLRGLMRRMLEQQEVIEPHEIQQLTSVEKQLRDLTGEPFG